MTYLSPRLARGIRVTLALGLSLALLATATFMSAAAAQNSQDITTSGGEMIRVNGDGTFQVDHTGSGGNFGAVRSNPDVVRLRSGELQSSDTTSDSVGMDRARSYARASNIWIVQFATYPLGTYLESIQSLGGTVHGYVPENSYFVEMSSGTAGQVEQLAFVTQTHRYLAQHKIDPTLDAALGAGTVGTDTYELALFETGAQQVSEVAAALASGGAVPLTTSAASGRIVARLSPAQVDLALSLDQVEFVDQWSEQETDVDNTRIVSGANFLEGVGGYTGQGLIGASYDTGLSFAHPEFASNPPIVHSNSTNISRRGHGTAAFGIIFADGLQPVYRGILPDAQGIAAASLRNDPGYVQKPDFYRYANNNNAVFVTSSVGGNRTKFYEARSAAVDEALFDTDILALQSQSNAGGEAVYDNRRNSRPEAWAKNVLSVGGIFSQNNSDVADDSWLRTTGSGAGSIGPAEDGRIKPDLSFYYDSVRTTSGTTGYGTFGGTSAATPTTAGYIGLLFEMWADGVFRPNSSGLNQPTTGLNRDIFAARPNAATMRALAINTAYDYPFSGSGPNVANTRVHQGWGRIDAQEAYERSMSGNMPLIVDETVLLRQGDSPRRYTINTSSGADCEFRATMVYTDPPGSPAVAKALVNDLSLRVTAPNGTRYWGNNGLLSSNWSSPGGSANDVDTVENVYVNNAPAGSWTVEVLPTQINQDAVLTTPDIDANFSLVVSGSCMGSGVTQPTPLPTTIPTPQTPTPTPRPTVRPTATPLPSGTAGQVLYENSFDASGTGGWSRANTTSTGGAWENSSMQQTSFEGVVAQLGSPAQGARALVTDGRGGTGNLYDVDGVVAIESPQITLPADAQSIYMDFSWFFNHSSGASRGDTFVVEIQAGNRRVAMTELGNNRVRSEEWQRRTLNLTNLRGLTVQITVSATDMGTDSVVEAGFDDLVITAVRPGGPTTPTLTPTATPRPTVRPTSTPRPTVRPTATPRPTVRPTSTPPPTVRPTATPRPTSTPRPTVRPTATSSQIVYQNFFDFAGSSGWRRDTTASSSGGAWLNSTMEQTVAEGAVVQLGSPVQGDRALVTDGRGGSADTYDVDGDAAIESPEITLPSDVESISMDFSWYFNHSSAATRGDLFMVEVEETGASVRRVAMTELGNNQVRSQGWQQETLNLTNLKGRTVRITLTARDMGSDATIEAGFDNLRITAVARTIDDVPTGAADIVTLAGRTDGWVRVGSTRNWVSAGCRSQLDAAGMDLKIVSWPTLAALSDAVPFDGCSQLLATHGGAPGAAGPDIVTLAGRTDGWVRVDGTRNWVGAACRPLLLDEGLSLNVVSWPTLAELTDAVPFENCDQLLAVYSDAVPINAVPINAVPINAVPINAVPSNDEQPDLVTMAGRTDGWVRVGGTRNWVGAACRPQLMAAGLELSVVSWATLSELTDAVPFENCDQLLAGLSG